MPSTNDLTPLNHKDRLGSLDGLRGLAALMVVCHHLCPFPSRHPIGVICATLWMGVDLFFVLSGFLITGVLTDTLGQPGYFRVFYIRRALRLFPLYVAIVAAVILANAVLGGSLTLWAIPYFGYGSNIVRDLGLPIGIVPKLDVSHLWSLALEEQFYLLWPLAIFLARTRCRIVWLCLAGVALSVALRFVAVAHAGHFILGTPYFELPMRLDGLLLGAAVAVALRSRAGIVMFTAGKLYAVLIAGMAAITLTFAVAGHGSMFAVPMVLYGYASAAITFAALVALAARSETLIARIFNVHWLRSLGKYSYGIYLVHLIAHSWYFEGVTRMQARCTGAFAYNAVSVAMFLGYAALCLGLAVFLYYAVEQRFLRLKSRYRYSDEQPSVKRHETEIAFQRTASVDQTA